MSTEDSETTESSPHGEPARRLTFVGALASVAVILVSLVVTLFFSAAVVLIVNDARSGIIAASGHGIHGTYLVTELDTSGKVLTTFGTFTSDDGSVVLVHAKLVWDSSDVGTVVACQYVPSLRGGLFPTTVLTGGPGDVIEPIVFVIVFVPLAGMGWLFVAGLVKGFVNDLVRVTIRRT